VEEVIGAGTVGVVKVLEDMSVNSCFNLVLDIIHQDTLVVSVPKSMVEVLATKKGETSLKPGKLELDS